MGSSAPLTLATPVATTAKLMWGQRSFSFVGTTSATTIRFGDNQNANVYFADLDGVGVQAAVPGAPTVLMMVGGLLAGAALNTAQRANPSPD